MIVRLVKLTFRPEAVPEFRDLFEGWHPRIIAMPGCRHLQLLQGTDDPHVFFTYSEWASVEHLEAYRNSEVFGSVWPVVKGLFAARAEAWTTDRTHALSAPTIPTAP